MERELLLTKLNLGEESVVLDLGCGTGRWATMFLGGCKSYVGVDFSLGLLEIARQSTADFSHKATFIPDSVSAPLRLQLPGCHFDRVVSLGLFVYLNDEEMSNALSDIVDLATPKCRAFFREPVGKFRRLTFLDHFSQEMGQDYNAIYREEREFLGCVLDVLGPAGFRLADCGEMYEAQELNNREETIQKWFVFVR